MKDQQGFTGAQLFLTFLSGAAAGAAVAMLTAPKSGRETREQLNGYIKRGKKKTREAIEAAPREVLPSSTIDGEMVDVHPVM